MSGALDGIRVLDFSNFIAGPYCAMLLGAMGAEVIRVEPPGGALDRDIGPYAPNGQAMYPWHYSCNKLGVTLDLKNAKAKGLLHKLLARTDVVLEAFSPGVKKKLGLDLRSLHAVNPAISLLSISGYGQYGPYAERGGLDTVAQGMAGLMAITGPEGGEPMRAGVAVVDYGAALYGLYGVMLALYQREKTGRGQAIDISLLDVAVSFMETVFAEMAVLGVERKAMGNRRPYTAPTNMFQAKDGYVYVSITTDLFWRRFCKVAGIDHLRDDPRFNSNRVRYKHQKELNQIAADWVGARTVEEVLGEMIPAGIAAGPVLTLPQVMADEHVSARNMILEMNYEGVGPVPIPGLAIKMSENPGQIDTPAPAVGQHNDYVYGELLSCTPEELAALAADGVI
ncbi:MAG: CoA transferase [Thermodesulfobacteriota bacterium]